MSEFTKEQLQEIIDTDHVQCGEASALARMALAGMEVEHKDKAPELSRVIYHFRDWNEGFPVERFKADYVISWMLANYPPAPQPLTTSERAELENYRNAQQVVLDENGLLPCPFCGSPAEHYPDGDMEGYSVMCGHKNGDCDSWVFGFSTPEEAEKSWNTRAAMLQGKADGNSPVIPDGWVDCSERMPEESGRYWCYVEEQNSLGKSCYQWNCSWNGDVWGGEMMYGRVTHWQPLPAAPQQEAE